MPLKRQIGVAFLAFSPRTNSVPLSDARSAYADPDPIGRDLAVASETLAQPRDKGDQMLAASKAHNEIREDSEEAEKEASF